MEPNRFQFLIDGMNYDKGWNSGFLMGIFFGLFIGSILNILAN